MAVTREKLYEEVWSEAMTKVAARYEVSSVFLARICRRLNVPSPPRGYWAQLAVGKAPPPPKLPAARPGDEIEWSRDGVARRQPLEAPALPPARAAGDRLPVRRHRLAHGLIIGSRQSFEEAAARVVANRGDILHSEYVRPRSHRLVDIFVASDSVSRAMALASNFFLALEDLGYRVTLAPNHTGMNRPEVDVGQGRQQYLPVRWRPGVPTVVFIGTVAIGLSIYEPTEYVDVQRVEGRYVRVRPPSESQLRGPERWTFHKEDMPAGRFILRAYSPYPRTDWKMEWAEAKRGDLRARFGEIIAELEKAAVTIVELVAEGERQRLIEEERWREEQRQRAEEERKRQKAEEERRRVEARKASREQLLSLIDEWVLARHIEEFFADAEKRVAQLPTDEREAIAARVATARSIFGGTNALELFRHWKEPKQR